MTARLDVACEAAAYKPSSFPAFIAALKDAWRVLHDIQWRAPWDRP